MKKKTLLNRDPNNTTSTSADDPSLCLLTFAGRLREAVIETNAALSALISIYAVLQTGITRGLRTRTHFRLKSAVCASRASYHLHQSNMTEIPALVDFDEQNHKKKNNLPGRDRPRSPRRRDEGCSRPVPDKHTHKNKSSKRERLFDKWSRHFATWVGGSTTCACEQTVSRSL